MILNKKLVYFYISYPYYFPHFLPIGYELKKENYIVKYILSNNQNNLVMEKIAKDNNLDYEFGEEKLFNKEVDIIFFANNFNKVSELSAKTIFMGHAIGTKNCAHDKMINKCDIVLVEGDYRYKKFSNEFPEYKYKLYKVGYSKLDLIVNNIKKETLIKKYNLDSSKKTIVYAPTFFPASIEKMSDSFPNDFKEYNIIVKPHYLSLQRDRYKKQRKKFEKWKKYSNCQIMGVEEYNLIPFLILADILISDESSAIFEFAALNKPVIINRFLKLRWTYYLNPNKLLKRMDKGIEDYRIIGANPNSYNEMVKDVYENINNPEKYEKIRLEKSKDLCGNVDGKVSNRIFNIVRRLLNE